MPVDARKRRTKGLNGKWKAIKNRGNEQPLKRKGKRPSGCALKKPAQPTIGTDRDQYIKSKYGWRKHERHGDGGFEHEPQAMAGFREPVRKRKPNDKKDRSRPRRKPQ